VNRETEDGHRGNTFKTDHHALVVLDALDDSLNTSELALSHTYSLTDGTEIVGVFEKDHPFIT
jgi:hypothetical protein